MKELRKDGAHCSTCHDNGAFGAERSAGTDGYSGGQRLKHGNFRLHPATAEQEWLRGLQEYRGRGFFPTRSEP